MCLFVQCSTPFTAIKIGDRDKFESLENVTAMVNKLKNCSIQCQKYIYKYFVEQKSHANRIISMGCQMKFYLFFSD